MDVRELITNLSRNVNVRNDLTFLDGFVSSYVFSASDSMEMMRKCLIIFVNETIIK